MRKTILLLAILTTAACSGVTPQTNRQTKNMTPVSNGTVVAGRSSGELANPDLAQRDRLIFSSQREPVSYQPALPKDGVVLGIYDPHHTFADDGDVGLQHIYIYWQALDQPKFKEDLATVRSQLRDAQDHHRGMMVTVEPYTRAANWRDGGRHLFSDILDGGFDHEIKTICTEVGAFKGPILVRWGHEMEHSSSRYPWAGRDPEDFKNAFRYFVETCRAYAPNAAYVWSPDGQENLADYYPGGAYVDVVGLSLYGFEGLEESKLGHARDFAEAFGERYGRVASFGKPVMIAELGVTGGQDYRNGWFKDLFRAVAAGTTYPLLHAVVYFNDMEPCHCYGFYGDPDWRIPAGWFTAAKQDMADHRQEAAAGSSSQPVGIQ